MRKREKIEKISTLDHPFWLHAFDLLILFIISWIVFTAFTWVYYSNGQLLNLRQGCICQNIPYPSKRVQCYSSISCTEEAFNIYHGHRFSSCFMWWCGCSGHDIFELDYTSRVYFLLMMLIKKERIYPFSHIIYMEKDHLVKQNSLPSFQWIILCYDDCYNLSKFKRWTNLPKKCPTIVSFL